MVLRCDDETKQIKAAVWLVAKKNGAASMDMKASKGTKKNISADGLQTRPRAASGREM